MSESEMKDALPPEVQNGGQEVGGIVVGKPVEDPLAILESAVKDAALERAEILNESDDKLDEFSRLELEMAELDKTDNMNTESSCMCTIDSLEKVIDSTKINKDEDMKTNSSKQKDSTDESTTVTRQNGQSSDTINVSLLDKGDTDGNQLGHEDLIAVLKGDAIIEDRKSEEPKKLEVLKETPTAHTPTPAPEIDSDMLIEGVTIEGEGEYQIMEVVDDIEDEAESILPSTSKVLSGTGLHTNSKKATSSQKLTPEEERAMAMEQIAGLNARMPRRRKQDIKPLQFETSELVSTLGADWSEDDDVEAKIDGERPTSSKNAAASNKQTKIVKKENPTKSQSTVEEVSSTAGDTKAEAATITAKKRRNSVGAKVTSVVLLKPVAEDASNEISTNTSDNVTTSTPEPTVSIGFKRTRTIKRRIIWDPDAPETTFSYAKLVRSNPKDRSDTGSLAVTPKQRSVTPKEIVPGEKKGTKRAPTPSLQSSASKSSNISESGQKAENFDMPSVSKHARRSQTISPDVSSSGGSTTSAKKKKISEIDRLMGDEGAANMLNSLENGRNKSAGEDSDNRPHKPLMRNRSSVSEKVSKKEAVTVPAASGSSPKNKRGPKPKASTSWDYVYQKKQQLSEDSMIIRRRSNSSYSSNASQHRLSLDGPTGLPTKSNAKSSEVSSDDSSTSATPRKSPSKSGLKSVNNVADEESLSINSNKSANATGNKAFEFAKPKDAKSNQKTPNRRNKSNATTTNTLTNDIKKAMPKRGPGRSSAGDRLGNSEQTTAQNTTASNCSTTTATSGSEDVCVRKLGKIGHILFNTKAAQISCTFTPQLMNKIVSALNNLAGDVNCHVVVVTTNSPNFCQGIDIANLATGSADQRKSAAIVLATATKNFLKTLATFPKPLVAGINGTIIGLGVIQLPLFDVVIASDNTSLETPYAKIGQTPEGFCIWQTLSNIRETAKTKLLWLAEKMHSTEASTSGFIDKLTTAERVNEDAMNIAKKLSAMSTETYRYMKDFIVKKRSDAINSSLDDEFDKITTQWTSAECFNKFKKSMEIGHF